MKKREAKGRMRVTGLWRRILLVRRPGLMVEFRAFFTEQNLVEEPLGITMEDLCDLRAQIWIRLTESVDDLAEVGLIDPDHLGKTVLPDAARIHAKFQIWVYVAIDWHLFTQCLS
jgi:hypothetical protein